MAMEHTSGALRSRNSASLAPEHVSGRQSASMVGRGCVVTDYSTFREHTGVSSQSVSQLFHGPAPRSPQIEDSIIIDSMSLAMVR